MFNTSAIMETIQKHKFDGRSFRNKLKDRNPLSYYFAFGEKSAPLLPGEDENTSTFIKMINRFSIEQIARNSACAAWYAKEQRAPFPEGEAAIARSPQVTVSYCLNVLYTNGYGSKALDDRWQYDWAVSKGFQGTFKEWWKEANR